MALDKAGPLRVAIVGCGNISRGYAATMRPHADKLKLVGAYDVEPARAEALVEEFGGRAYPSLKAVLDDPGIECVVNLTIHQAHVEVVTAALEAGKHVHTEKPIALDPADALRMVELAKRKNVRLSSAPITFMGEAQQTAAKIIRDGRLGTVRVLYAEMNWARIEAWHPNPGPFYEVGVVYDVGVYPLTVMTAILGPVARVSAFGKVVYPDRVTKDGKPFHITTPDWMCGYLEFQSGPIARLTSSFYVGPTKQVGIEFHGDRATMHLQTAHDFHSKVEVRDFAADQWVEQPLVKEPYKGTEWARGLTELHDALRTGRKQRATGEQAAHVVEVIAGMHAAARGNRPVEIASRFDLPAPMDWAR
jgi:predicted dehydrogenase